MHLSKRRRECAEWIVQEAIALAQDVEECDAFIRELLCVLKRALGFETAFAGGPALGSAIVTEAVDAETLDAARRLLITGSEAQRDVLRKLFEARLRARVSLEPWAQSAMCSDGLAAEASSSDAGLGAILMGLISGSEALSLSSPMGSSRDSSMACICLQWRGAPIAFIELARHGGAIFDEEEIATLHAIAPSLEAALIANLSSQRAQCAAALTPREREIAAMVCQGFSNREIGRLLGSSPHTVRNQTCQIFRKAEVDNRVELAALMSGSASQFTLGLSVERWLEGFRARGLS